MMAESTRVILRPHYLRRWTSFAFLKQEALAQRINVSQGYLSRISLGVSSCSLWDAGRLVAKINFHLRHDGMRERLRLRDLVDRMSPAVTARAA
jgi:predicted transcriptional regulator